MDVDARISAASCMEGACLPHCTYRPSWGGHSMRTNCRRVIVMPSSPRRVFPGADGLPGLTRPHLKRHFCRYCNYYYRPHSQYYNLPYAGLCPLSFCFFSLSPFPLSPAAPPLASCLSRSSPEAWSRANSSPCR